MDTEQTERAQEIINALVAQRNSAMDRSAELTADITVLRRKLEAVQKAIPIPPPPSDPV